MLYGQVTREEANKEYEAIKQFLNIKDDNTPLYPNNPQGQKPGDEPPSTSENNQGGNNSSGENKNSNMRTRKNSPFNSTESPNNNSGPSQQNINVKLNSGPKLDKGSNLFGPQPQKPPEQGKVHNVKKDVVVEGIDKKKSNDVNEKENKPEEKIKQGNENEIKKFKGKKKIKKKARDEEIVKEDEEIEQGNNNNIKQEEDEKLNEKELEAKYGSGFDCILDKTTNKIPDVYIEYNYDEEFDALGPGVIHIGELGDDGKTVFDSNTKNTPVGIFNGHIEEAKGKVFLYPDRKKDIYETIRENLRDQVYESADISVERAKTYYEAFIEYFEIQEPRELFPDGPNFRDSNPNKKFDLEIRDLPNSKDQAIYFNYPLNNFHDEKFDCKLATVKDRALDGNFDRMEIKNYYGELLFVFNKKQVDVNYSLFKEPEKKIETAITEYCKFYLAYGFKDYLKFVAAKYEEERDNIEQKYKEFKKFLCIEINDKVFEDEKEKKPQDKEKKPQDIEKKINEPLKKNEPTEDLGKGLKYRIGKKDGLSSVYIEYYYNLKYQNLGPGKIYIGKLGEDGKTVLDFKTKNKEVGIIKALNEKDDKINESNSELFIYPGRKTELDATFREKLKDRLYNYGDISFESAEGYYNNFIKHFGIKKPGSLFPDKPILKDSKPKKNFVFEIQRDPKNESQSISFNYPLCFLSGDPFNVQLGTIPDKDLEAAVINICNEFEETLLELESDKLKNDDSSEDDNSSENDNSHYTIETPMSTFCKIHLNCRFKNYLRKIKAKTKEEQGNIENEYEKFKKSLGIEVNDSVFKDIKVNESHDIKKNINEPPEKNETVNRKPDNSKLIEDFSQKEKNESSMSNNKLQDPNEIDFMTGFDCTVKTDVLGTPDVYVKYSYHQKPELGKKEYIVGDLGKDFKVYSGALGSGYHEQIGEIKVKPGTAHKKLYLTPYGKSLVEYKIRNELQDLVYGTAKMRRDVAISNFDEFVKDFGISKDRELFDYKQNLRDLKANRGFYIKIEEGTGDKGKKIYKAYFIYRHKLSSTLKFDFELLLGSTRGDGPLKFYSEEGWEVFELKDVPDFSDKNLKSFETLLKLPKHSKETLYAGYRSYLRQMNKDNKVDKPTLMDEMKYFEKWSDLRFGEDLFIDYTTKEKVPDYKKIQDKDLDLKNQIKNPPPQNKEINVEKGEDIDWERAYIEKVEFTIRKLSNKERTLINLVYKPKFASSLEQLTYDLGYNRKNQTSVGTVVCPTAEIRNDGKGKKCLYLKCDEKGDIKNEWAKSLKTAVKDGKITLDIADKEYDEIKQFLNIKDDHTPLYPNDTQRQKPGNNQGGNNSSNKSKDGNMQEGQNPPSSRTKPTGGNDTGTQPQKPPKQGNVSNVNKSIFVKDIDEKKSYDRFCYGENPASDTVGEIEVLLIFEPELRYNMSVLSYNLGRRKDGENQIYKDGVLSGQFDDVKSSNKKLFLSHTVKEDIRKKYEEDVEDWAKKAHIKGQNTKAQLKRAIAMFLNIEPAQGPLKPTNTGMFNNPQNPGTQFQSGQQNFSSNINLNTQPPKGGPQTTSSLKPPASSGGTTNNPQDLLSFQEIKAEKLDMSTGFSVSVDKNKKEGSLYEVSLLFGITLSGKLVPTSVPIGYTGDSGKVYTTAHLNVGRIMNKDGHNLMLYTLPSMKPYIDILIRQRLYYHLINGDYSKTTLLKTYEDLKKKYNLNNPKDLFDGKPLIKLLDAGPVDMNYRFDKKNNNTKQINISMFLPEIDFKDAKLPLGESSDGKNVCSPYGELVATINGMDLSNNFSGMINTLKLTEQGYYIFDRELRSLLRKETEKKPEAKETYSNCYERLKTTFKYGFSSLYPSQQNIKLNVQKNMPTTQTEKIEQEDERKGFECFFGEYDGILKVRKVGLIYDIKNGEIIFKDRLNMGIMNESNNKVILNGQVMGEIVATKSGEKKLCIAPDKRDRMRKAFKKRLYGFLFNGWFNENVLKKTYEKLMRVLGFDESGDNLFKEKLLINPGFSETKVHSFSLEEAGVANNNKVYTLKLKLKVEPLNKPPIEISWKNLTLLSGRNLYNSVGEKIAFLKCIDNMQNYDNNLLNLTLTGIYKINRYIREKLRDIIDDNRSLKNSCVEAYKNLKKEFGYDFEVNLRDEMCNGPGELYDDDELYYIENEVEEIQKQNLQNFEKSQAEGSKHDFANIDMLLYKVLNYDANKKQKEIGIDIKVGVKTTEVPIVKKYPSFFVGYLKDGEDKIYSAENILVGEVKKTTSNENRITVTARKMEEIVEKVKDNLYQDFMNGLYDEETINAIYKATKELLNYNDSKKIFEGRQLLEISEEPRALKYKIRETTRKGEYEIFKKTHFNKEVSFKVVLGITKDGKNVRNADGVCIAEFKGLFDAHNPQNCSMFLSKTGIYFFNAEARKYLIKMVSESRLNKEDANRFYDNFKKYYEIKDERPLFEGNQPKPPQPKVGHPQTSNQTKPPQNPPNSASNFGNMNSPGKPFPIVSPYNLGNYAYGVDNNPTVLEDRGYDFEIETLDLGSNTHRVNLIYRSNKIPNFKEKLLAGYTKDSIDVLSDLNSIILSGKIKNDNQNKKKLYLTPQRKENLKEDMKDYLKIYYDLGYIPRKNIELEYEDFAKYLGVKKIGKVLDSNEKIKYHNPTEVECELRGADQGQSAVWISLNYTAFANKKIDICMGCLAKNSKDVKNNFGFVVGKIKSSGPQNKHYLNMNFTGISFLDHQIRRELGELPADNDTAKKAIEKEYETFQKKLGYENNEPLFKEPSIKPFNPYLQGQMLPPFNNSFPNQPNLYQIPFNPYLQGQMSPPFNDSFSNQPNPNQQTQNINTFPGTPRWQGRSIATTQDQGKPTTTSTTTTTQRQRIDNDIKKEIYKPPEKNEPTEEIEQGLDYKTDKDKNGIAKVYIEYYYDLKYKDLGPGIIYIGELRKDEETVFDLDGKGIKVGIIRSLNEKDDNIKASDRKLFLLSGKKDDLDALVREKLKDRVYKYANISIQNAKEYYEKFKKDFGIKETRDLFQDEPNFRDLDFFRELDFEIQNGRKQIIKFKYTLNSYPGKTFKDTLCTLSGKDLDKEYIPIKNIYGETFIVIHKSVLENNASSNKIKTSVTEFCKFYLACKFKDYLKLLATKNNEDRNKLEEEYIEFKKHLCIEMDDNVFEDDKKKEPQAIKKKKNEQPKVDKPKEEIEQGNEPKEEIEQGNKIITKKRKKEKKPVGILKKHKPRKGFEQGNDNDIEKEEDEELKENELEGEYGKSFDCIIDKSTNKIPDVYIEYNYDEEIDALGPGRLYIGKLGDDGKTVLDSKEKNKGVGIINGHIEKDKGKVFLYPDKKKDLDETVRENLRDQVYKYINISVESAKTYYRNFIEYFDIREPRELFPDEPIFKDSNPDREFDLEIRELPNSKDQDIYFNYPLNNFHDEKFDCKLCTVKDQDLNGNFNVMDFTNCYEEILFVCDKKYVVENFSSKKIKANITEYCKFYLACRFKNYLKILAVDYEEERDNIEQKYKEFKEFLCIEMNDKVFEDDKKENEQPKVKKPKEENGRGKPTMTSTQGQSNTSNKAELTGGTNFNYITHELPGAKHSYSVKIPYTSTEFPNFKRNFEVGFTSDYKEVNSNEGELRGEIMNEKNGEGTVRLNKAGTSILINKIRDELNKLYTEGYVPFENVNREYEQFKKKNNLEDKNPISEENKDITVNSEKKYFGCYKEDKEQDYCKIKIVVELSYYKSKKNAPSWEVYKEVISIGKLREGENSVKNEYGFEVGKIKGPDKIVLTPLGYKFFDTKIRKVILQKNEQDNSRRQTYERNYENLQKLYGYSNIKPLYEETQNKETQNNLLFDYCLYGYDDRKNKKEHCIFLEYNLKSIPNEKLKFRIGSCEGNLVRGLLGHEIGKIKSIPSLNRNKLCIDRKYIDYVNSLMRAQLIFYQEAHQKIDEAVLEKEYQTFKENYKIADERPLFEHTNDFKDSETKEVTFKSYDYKDSTQLIYITLDLALNDADGALKVIPREFLFGITKNNKQIIDLNGNVLAVVNTKMTKNDTGSMQINAIGKKKFDLFIRAALELYEKISPRKIDYVHTYKLIEKELGYENSSPLMGSKVKPPKLRTKKPQRNEKPPQRNERPPQNIHLFKNAPPSNITDKNFEFSPEIQCSKYYTHFNVVEVEGGLFIELLYGEKIDPESCQDLEVGRLSMEDGWVIYNNKGGIMGQIVGIKRAGDDEIDYLLYLSYDCENCLIKLERETLELRYKLEENTEEEIEKEFANFKNYIGYCNFIPIFYKPKRANFGGKEFPCYEIGGKHYIYDFHMKKVGFDMEKIMDYFVIDIQKKKCYIMYGSDIYDEDDMFGNVIPLFSDLGDFGIYAVRKPHAKEGEEDLICRINEFEKIEHIYRLNVSTLTDILDRIEKEKEEEEEDEIDET